MPNNSFILLNNRKKYFKMKKNVFSILLLTIYLFLYSPSIMPQDTFSIVAVDTVTGEIGSAGASCVGPIGGVGAFILSDVIEQVGAIHTQASYISANQNYAHSLMLLGLSPQQIIDSLVANDAQNNPTIRQYGIVDLTRNGESAAFTGIDCLDYKGHATGNGYAIQGNILLGEIIIDTMKTIFLNTQGPLADRLMKTLEAAKIIGADTRCAPRGTSSQSAFIKVVRIGDNGDFYLQEIVPDSPVGVDPIDILREQFNQWKDSLFNTIDPFLSEILIDQDTITADGTSKANIMIEPKNNSDTLLASGLEILLLNTGEGTLSDVTDLGDGTYIAVITSPVAIGADTVSATVISGTDTVTLFQKVFVVYITPTSVQSFDSPNPDLFYLFQNYPQPFNPATTIKYQIPELSFVTLKVFDLLGNEIATLVKEKKQPGIYKVSFNADGLASGVYIYKLTAGNFATSKKLILLK
ncbi:MAG: DUF1028 domain-containing protein [Bacteroidetes bacterium]|nr:DUF1028 domain-containing protein [Bacteroidota bacterium]